MISSLIQITNYTQQTTIPSSNATKPAAQVNNTSKDNSPAAANILTEHGKETAKTRLSVASNPPITTEMFTDKGSINIDLDNYSSNSPSNPVGYLNINELPPLLMPSEQNINTITEHVSTRFKQLLADYNIPSAPDKITFDNKGKVQIPIDYPYANELNHALEENTGLGRELRTLNAISSHAAAIQERMPFIEEMGSASSKTETDRIIAKYSHLLHDNHSYKSMALMFSNEGDVSVTADGEPIKFT